jgi:hypothetical protein
LLAEPVEPLIGNDDTGLFWVDGGIREVGRVTQGGLGDGLEECRLADVGKTNLEPWSDHCRRKKQRKREGWKGGQGALNSLCGIKKWTVL